MICVETFFPKKPVECIHEGVIKLRLVLIRLLLGHIICAIIALAFVSIITCIA